MTETLLLKMQHSSLQFSDTPAQQASDVEKLFVEGEDFPIKTGTEAGNDGPGGNTNRELLVEAAKDYKHKINFAGDAWVAVDDRIILPRSLTRDDVFLVSNDHMVGHGTDRVMPTLEFQHVELGGDTVSVGSVHYPTKGAVPGSPNYQMNVEIAGLLERWLRDVARGKNLGFINGDFNMPDRTTDWALGHDFLSMADELKAWENSGHGPIDGFCSFNLDGRVSAKRFSVLDDKEMHLYSDHYVCRGVWEIVKRKS